MKALLAVIAVGVLVIAGVLIYGQVRDGQRDTAERLIRDRASAFCTYNTSIDNCLDDITQTYVDQWEAAGRPDIEEMCASTESAASLEEQVLRGNIC